LQEYLITQLQHTGAETIAPATTVRSTNVRLNFNHPTRFLAWVVKSSDSSRDTHGAFTMKANAASTGQGETDEKYAVVASVKLQLNGHDRFSERRGSYFSQVQPFKHLKTRPAAGVYMYSFAIKPDEHQVRFEA